MVREQRIGDQNPKCAKSSLPPTTGHFTVIACALGGEARKGVVLYGTASADWSQSECGIRCK